MALIKPRTRGKQLVRHRTRLDRETNETLYAYAHFIGEPTEYVLNQVIDTVLGEGQGLPAVARRAPGARSCRDTPDAAPNGSDAGPPRPTLAGRSGLDAYASAARSTDAPRPARRPTAARDAVRRGGRACAASARIPFDRRRRVPRRDRGAPARHRSGPGLRLRHPVVLDAVLPRVAAHVARRDRRVPAGAARDASDRCRPIPSPRSDRRRRSCWARRITRRVQAARRTRSGSPFRSAGSTPA